MLDIGRDARGRSDSTITSVIGSVRATKRSDPSSTRRRPHVPLATRCARRSARDRALIPCWGSPCHDQAVGEFAPVAQRAVQRRADASISLGLVLDPGCRPERWTMTTCWRWWHSSSATQSPGSSAAKPTILRSTPERTSMAGHAVSSPSTPGCSSSPAIRRDRTPDDSVRCATSIGDVPNWWSPRNSKPACRRRGPRTPTRRASANRVRVVVLHCPRTLAGPRYRTPAGAVLRLPPSTGWASVARRPGSRTARTMLLWCQKAARLNRTEIGHSCSRAGCC